MGKDNKPIDPEYKKHLPSPTAVLFSSQRTAINAFLMQLVAKYANFNTQAKAYSTIGLCINTHPYQLTPEEISEIRNIYREMTKGRFMVDMVNLSPEQLTVELVKDRFIGLVMYNPTDWLNAQKDGLVKFSLADIELYYPEVNFIREFTAEEKQFFHESGVSASEAIELLFRGVLIMRPCPIYLFSAETPLNPTR